MQPINNPGKLEFITLDSRLTLQRGNIYQNKLKSSTEEGQYRFVAFVAFVLLVVLTIEEIVAEGEYFKIIRVIVYAFFLAPLFTRIFQTLFIKTWKNIIPLKDVKAISTRPLQNGLETEVVLSLKSGRKKFYVFRNAEGQLEAFTEAVAAQTSLSIQMAV